ncbi:MAG TPA: 3-methyl-2-oxobutanoate hydroxymethyltransferase [Aeromicrobium sp.]|nr:3-methyl-2-oxobutanoate hydroxymethyltransferase [Aeromicrobium sp.]
MEEIAPYGAGPKSAGSLTKDLTKVRTHHLQKWKEQGQKWVMLTTYDQYSAQIFEEAGVPVLFIGDSAANNVYGYESSLPITVDEMLSLVKAVTRTAKRALVVADLPFGSYQRSPEQGYDTAVRFMKEGLAHAVKLEGGAEMAPQIKLMTDGAIPVMAHIGFTPQAEHNLGGYRVQGRGDAAAKLLEDALAVQDAGAFSVVMEMVPAPIAQEITETLHIPTIGIGAGAGCDAQVLVWQDMMGLRTGKAPRFVKRYADLHSIMLNATEQFIAEVADGSFPGAEHSFEQ